ncbi:uncharacterized protein V6R79_015972 [Siganus canaliculatus]
MATSEGLSPQWKTTIIISTSLQNHGTSKILSSQPHRIRFSDSIESGTFIFPLSGIAFLLVDTHDEHLNETGLSEKISAFVHVHRNSFLLLSATEKNGWEILSKVQHRFFDSNLRILPVTNNAEAVNGMLTIAKATSKHHGDSIRGWIALARAHIIERSPVWEMLKDNL